MEKVSRVEQQRGHPPGPPSLFWEELVAQVCALSAELACLQEEDVQAYFHLTRARAAGEAQGLKAAVQEAVACPQRIMAAVHTGLTLLLRIGEQCRRHLVSDLWVAGELLGAALRGAYHIACANLPLVADAAARRTLARELARALQGAEASWQQVKQALMERGYGSHPGAG